MTQKHKVGQEAPVDVDPILPSFQYSRSNEGAMRWAARNGRLSLVGSDEFCLCEDVACHGTEEGGFCQAGLRFEGHVEGVEREVVMMGAVAGGWGGAAVGDLSTGIP